MKANLTEKIQVAGKHIKSDSKVVIFGHVNPDGDAIGSTLALYNAIKNKVAEVNVILPNNYPDTFKWMPSEENILIFEEEPQKSEKIITDANLLFFCDHNDPKRIEGMAKHINTNDNIKIIIDHHPDPVPFADYTIFDTSVSSASELMYEVLTELYGSELDIDTATCLLTGIITDTGLFDHNSENLRTFEIVANLIKLGANKEYIINKIYKEKPYRRFKLMGNTLLNRLTYLPKYRTSYIYISQEDIEKYDYQNGDSEEFTNIALSMENVIFSVLFIQKEDYIKLSLRSLGNFDVNEIARKYYNGGGHTNASGGKSYKSMGITISEFTELLEEYKSKLLKSANELFLEK